MCAGCSTANEWSSRHCYACGGLIKAPLRPEVELAKSMKVVKIPILYILDIILSKTGPK